MQVILSPHFNLDEFLQSRMAAVNDIDMTPTLDVITNLRLLCRYILEPLRTGLSRPIVISSGYRPVALNQLIGGAASSQHVLGQAADITIQGMSTGDVMARIRKFRLPFDQVIDEFGQWTHVSYSDKHRRQALKAIRVNGQTQYTELP